MTGTFIGVFAIRWLRVPGQQRNVSYYSNLMEEGKNVSRKLWKAIKSLTSTNVRTIQVQSLLIYGEDITDTATLSTQW